MILGRKLRNILLCNFGVVLKVIPAIISRKTTVKYLSRTSKDFFVKIGIDKKKNKNSFTYLACVYRCLIFKNQIIYFRNKNLVFQSQRKNYIFKQSDKILDIKEG